jgi:predicted ATPase
VGRARLFGREAEQASLAGWLSEAETGAPRAVVCTGEPGIGKTRLAEETGEIARGRGAVVVWGLGDATAGTPPYWMWRQVLRAVEYDMDAMGLTSAPADDAARFRLFESVSSVLAARASDRPVLVVLDDVHWADEASLLLLRHVVRTLRNERLLLMVNCRELTGRPGEILLDVCRAPVARTLALGGLSVRSVQEALGGLTATTIDEHTAAAARELTGGNPLFLLELSRAMQHRCATRSWRD